MTGISHEHNSAVELATQWILQPRPLTLRRAIVAEVRERFGLNALEAVEAIRDAERIRREGYAHADLT